MADASKFLRFIQGNVKANMSARGNPHIIHACAGTQKQTCSLKLVNLNNVYQIKQSLTELDDQLSQASMARVESASQRLLDSICRQIKKGKKHVPVLRVHVLGVRPCDDYAELHGLYEPADSGRYRARMYIWMRTAKRHKVVAFKTFVRTLIHELCHHLDYEYYQLQESPHTKGFYRRESYLVKQLWDCLNKSVNNEFIIG